MSASGLNCPSDTTASCYKYESSTVSSGGCSKTCTYKVANTPNCGSNAHVTGSGTSCSCECNSGYSGDPFSGCSLSCSPLANESSDSSTCKTASYSCSDGCGGNRTCYKSACTGSQVCYNKSCCTPKWPSYQGYDYNNCMTSSDGTVSDGCGGTATKYKSACTGSQVCYNKSCCTPNWPSYQGLDYNNCMTVEDGTVSDGCGGTATKYKSACTGNQTCNGSGQCIEQSCSSRGMYDTESSCCDNFCSSGDGGCAQDGNCWKRAKAKISFTNNPCNIALYLKNSSSSTRLETGSHTYIEPGTYELWVGTLGNAKLGLSGSVPSTTLSMSASGTTGNGTYGNYTFEAGKFYYLSTSDCSASTTYTAKVVCERVADTYADCRLAQDTGYKIDHVYIEFTGTIYNGNPDEKWQNIYKNQTTRVYMNITGGKCHFGGPYSGQYGDIVSSSSAYCTLTYYPSTKFCNGWDCD